MVRALLEYWGSGVQHIGRRCEAGMALAGTRGQ